MAEIKTNSIDYLGGDPAHYAYTDLDGGPAATDLTTGEVSPALWYLVPSGSSIITPAKRAADQRRKQNAKERDEREFYREAKRVAETELGGYFISKFSRDEPPINLDRETLARLIYLCTFLDYSGRLMKTQRAVMTKDDAQGILKLSPATFYRFWAKVISEGYLTISSDGSLYPSPRLFSRGRLSVTGYSEGRTKIFIKQMRRLYEATPVRAHHYLGAVFLMLPFINIKYNVLCRNPFEDDIEKVDTMSMDEFCTAMGLRPRSAADYRRAYRELTFPLEDGRKQRFCITVQTDEGKEMIFINPRVLFRGDNWHMVENLILHFS